ncbi:hypothetical protein RJ639_039211 [Escallonia herrerae]|uniref:Hflx-type G domain-containing protein n=1 Tax=Escallonia herrerae TaxID=1293975 RepID=A0AA88WPV5_9ASTE|nr:hypothetical protein RJ639_039211 [Escallonia herrerae]
MVVVMAIATAKPTRMPCRAGHRTCQPGPDLKPREVGGAGDYDGGGDRQEVRKGYVVKVAVLHILNVLVFPNVADTYFGKGTLKTVKCHLNAVESEHAWGKPVLDRVGLIIEIFHAHAQTKEGKLQAELAALMYKRTRLVRLRVSGGRSTFGGEAEVVSARGRGSGGRGFISGAGETELQLQRRRILERRKQLLSEIEDVRRTRALQRAARKRHAGSRGQDMATVAVVGYTNAGKSTLVSTLSGSHLYSDDRLFATVDPKLRSVVLPSGRKVLLSDTVGFISELPVQLVVAFHATLEEVAEADLLVHVVDSSAPNLDEQRDTVLQVLEQIGVSEEKLQNMIEVRNKIDLEKEEMGADDCGEENEANSDSGAEDDDTAPEQLYDENSCNVLLSSSQDLEEAMDDEQCDCSDGRVSPGDDGGASKDQQKESSKDWKTMRKDSIYQYKYVAHVKTSAVTGVGLQELLVLIDKKLEPQKVLERDVFDRKWRPARGEDTGIAVEH